MKYYRLKDFESEDIEKAKQYLKTAYYGYLETCLDEKVDEWIEKTGDIEFSCEDTFEWQFSMKTLGADILAAIGVAINERTKHNKH